MPAIDSCEPQIVTALQKEGWQVKNRHYSIAVEERLIFADLRLQRHHRDETYLIVIEVKCFADEKTQLGEFYGVVGQYLAYRQALAITQQDVPIYLATPLTAYQTLFQRRLMQAVIAEVKIKLVVVDLEIEEVALWIH